LARKTYEQLIREFPGSREAGAAKKMIEMNVLERREAHPKPPGK